MLASYALRAVREGISVEALFLVLISGIFLMIFGYEWAKHIVCLPWRC